MANKVILDSFTAMHVINSSYVFSEIQKVCHSAEEVFELAQTIKRLEYKDGSSLQRAAALALEACYSVLKDYDDEDLAQEVFSWRTELFNKWADAFARAAFKLVDSTWAANREKLQAKGLLDHFHEGVKVSLQLPYIKGRPVGTLRIDYDGFLEFVETPAYYEKSNATYTYKEKTYKLTKKPLVSMMYNGEAFVKQIIKAIKRFSIKALQ